MIGYVRQFFLLFLVFNHLKQCKKLIAMTPTMENDGTDIQGQFWHLHLGGRDIGVAMGLRRCRLPEKLFDSDC